MRLTLIGAILICGICFSQQGINYKAVVKDGSGNIVANDLIAVQFTILDGATTVYGETHTPTTNENGIIILNIGEGAPIGAGDFSTIDWSSANHFLNVQINTGDGLTDMGTTAFKTVPYAKVADVAKSLENPLWIKNSADRISYNAGNVGVGDSNPLSPFSVIQSTGIENTMRLESRDHPAGKDLLELQIPSGSPATSQFIEMQNGSEIVAAVNADGSARFKSVQFEDNSVQTTAAIGPRAFGFIQSSGNITSGSGNFTVEWVAALNRYEITISGINYFYRNFSTFITTVTSNVVRSRITSNLGKIVVYLYNASGAPLQGEFQFITF
ncbi:hypothetical protein [Cochleicola gelatinilyticus]|uniref:Uncharacterized protein n=1 Tax=Cochleicola gelatinilyticus TaxID=1763537 RepID=A0A167HJV5_9FLAO|nr:hypothetical protein [Cochleicola gelatinilyticus]OAB78686.1 hypothetical protein ULVI_08880 [Cochleicola gelatinilyticus]